jgi:hypothetical protein
MQKYGVFVMDSIGFGDPKGVKILIKFKKEKKKGTVGKKRDNG